MTQRCSAVLLVSLALLAGCHTAPKGAASSGPAGQGQPAAPAGKSLAQGYALLYSTIAQDADVDKALMLKSPDPRVAETVKAIAQFCGQAKAKLEAFALEDPSLNLNNDGLPALEIKTRDAIGSTTTKQILFGTGKEFEFRLLMTQHEALNYIAHLAGVLAKAETNEARGTYLKEIAQKSASLHRNVMELMETPYVGKPSK